MAHTGQEIALRRISLLRGRSAAARFLSGAVPVPQYSSHQSASGRAFPWSGPNKNIAGALRGLLSHSPAPGTGRSRNLLSANTASKNQSREWYSRLPTPLPEQRCQYNVCFLTDKASPLRRRTSHNVPGNHPVSVMNEIHIRDIVVIDIDRPF